MSRRDRAPRRGAAAVELALSLPIVLMLAGAVFDYGMFMRSLAFANNAVREGARAGARMEVSDTPGPEEVALTSVARVLDDAGVASGAYDVSAAITGDDGIAVSVDIPFTPLVGLVPTPASARAAIVMRLQD